jgi:2'-5' RNA ligase
MSDPRPSDRLFLALYPDAAQRDAIAELQAELAGERSLGRRPRWVPPRQAHATLVFLGEVPRERRDDVVAAARRAAARSAPFRWRFEGLGGFPSPRRPRVLWLGVAEGAEEARALHDALAAELADAGLAPPDPRPFSPHLTLARLRDRPAGPVPSLPARTPAATVDTLAVMRSELGPEGASHLPLARLALGGPENAEEPDDAQDA